MTHVIAERPAFVMPFGKYEGVELDDIPTRYLRWCVRNIENKTLASQIAQYLTHYR